VLYLKNFDASSGAIFARIYYELSLTNASVQVRAATQITMLSWVQEAVKMNPFSSPFTTAKCQALQDDGARPLVPNRNIAAAAVAEGGQ